MIPLAVPNLGKLEAEYVSEAIFSGWVGPDGPFVERFEDMVAKAAGREWAVATTTGTMALLAAFQATHSAGQMGCVPNAAFPAAANMYTLMCCPITIACGGHNHDTQFYGRVCDRAPAIGELPTTADLECYSFAANKTAACGQGGAVVGDIWSLRDEVRKNVTQQRGRMGGNNGRLGNLYAAVGCAQMERLDELRAAKRQIWYRYLRAGLPMVERGASRWMATIADESLDGEGAMANAGIEFRREGYGVSIPCSTNLTEADQDKVIRVCEGFL